jgi:DNA-directed RNA polymerase subunit RPC12/RpoP
MQTEGFRCSVCGMQFDSRTMLERHETEDHNGGNVYRCTACGSQFTTQELLEAHSSVHR